ncbi:YLR419W [Saccharomyces arboricola H-6]|uniref:RNA helicase n=1 Tax=Saccharomyces arboricola (strain H-6 / AS 2.3317 / CBS 10644) TaxID=1160507 RepID=J8PZ53_SACAR|nr:YLR419W [Saccharomyces arboricola H-6]
MAKKNKSSSKNSTPVNDTPAATGKKKTKGKKGQEPEPEDDIKAKQQLNRAKVTSTASWTGKLPHTILHETCQKRKWNKVEYDMKKIGNKGFIAIAVLSFTDPKTKETLTVRMSDPTYNKAAGKGLAVPQETPVEARHMASTIALYRIAYNTNLHMMLPPNHKKTWYALDDFRKETLKTGERRMHKLFDLDPFKTMVEDRKLKIQRDKEHLAQNNQAQKEHVARTILSSHDGPSSKRNSKEDKFMSHKNSHKPSLVRFPKKVWENSTFIDLDECSRQLIETSLRVKIDWQSKKITHTSEETSEDRKQLMTKLLTLQFRPKHVQEAMSYKDPLSFLLFNLPEDDLPPFFHKKKEDAKNKVEISNLPLSTRMAVERLTEIGVSSDEALLALQENKMDENEAAGFLTKECLPTLKSDPHEAVSEAESIECWNQELESFESIYEGCVLDAKENSHYTLNLIEKLKIKLKVYRTKNYPASLPGIIVSTFDKNFKLPDYIKKQTLNKLLHYLQEGNLIGDMLAYHIYEWLKENISTIIDNPGPLISESDWKDATNQKNMSKNKANKQNSNSRNFARNSISEEVIRNLKNEYTERIKSPEYKNMQLVREQLPAWKKQKVIIDLINNNDVVLITGETGSGKSTQVVQFVLDFLQGQKGDFSETKIVCTQPRRISAIGLAERVSDERCITCGDEVGYVIRGVNKTKAFTRIKFMTTGVLVRLLQNARTMLENTIVVIDEVHERSIDTDLIVTLMKNLLRKVRGMKIVLMSATVNVDLFKKFFPGLVTCHIEGRTFPITDYFLEDILDSLDFKIKREKALSYDGDSVDEKSDDDLYLRPRADSKFFASGQINYDLLCQVVKHVDKRLKGTDSNGSIIVFLPGVGEINKCCKLLSDRANEANFIILPLHSALTPDDQKRVFRKYSGKRKVVVSTNIAETSITIDDCVATIDTGRAKSMFYNPKDNTTKLIETFISKAEAKQRRGRAGRVRAGLSYKLFSRGLYENEMISMPIPEIKRIPLESLYLSVKAMGIKNVKVFLSAALDAPPLPALQKAERMLTTVGLVDEFDNSLTQLGQFISLMPVMDSKHGKLLIYGILFGCTDMCVLLVSILGVGALPFVGGFENREKIKKLLSKYENRGDLYAVLKIVRDYLKIKDSTDKRNYMRDHLLSYNKINEIKSSIAQYYSILKDVGFLPMNYKAGSSSDLNRNERNFDILRAILTGAFYPHVARIQLPEVKYSSTSSGAIEKDPEAKMVKYWIRSEEYQDKLEGFKKKDSDGTQKVDLDDLPLPATRAFIHPSSVLFSTNSVTLEDTKLLSEVEGPISKQSKIPAIIRYPFVLFNTSQVTNKLYLRDLTPTTTLSLLLFGGAISYDVGGTTHSPGIVVDNWLPIRTWCKNGVLIKELRTQLDEAIRKKLESPDYANKFQNDSSDPDETLKIVEKIITSEQ